MLPEQFLEQRAKQPEQQRRSPDLTPPTSLVPKNTTDEQERVLNITYCPIRYAGTEPCMGKPCALAVRDKKSDTWLCALAINPTTANGRFAFNGIDSGARGVPASSKKGVVN